MRIVDEDVEPLFRFAAAAPAGRVQPAHASGIDSEYPLQGFGGHRRFRDDGDLVPLRQMRRERETAPLAPAERAKMLIVDRDAHAASPA